MLQQSFSTATGRQLQQSTAQFCSLWYLHEVSNLVLMANRRIPQTPSNKGKHKDKATTLKPHKPKFEQRTPKNHTKSAGVTKCEAQPSHYISATLLLNNPICNVNGSHYVNPNEEILKFCHRSRNSEQSQMKNLEQREAEKNSIFTEYLSPTKSNKCSFQVPLTSVMSFNQSTAEYEETDSADKKKREEVSKIRPTKKFETISKKVKESHHKSKSIENSKSNNNCNSNPHAHQQGQKPAVGVDKKTEFYLHSIGNKYLEKIWKNYMTSQQSSN